MTINRIELSLFSSRMNAICEEMGLSLARAAFSPNIKDRYDFSCALFDAKGQLCAQAAHIPVHLGSMAYAMLDLVNTQQWFDGDVLVVNDPFLGGTHLPDVTLIAPVFIEDTLMGFAVNRAHHANIGSDIPGSMPLSKTLKEEGVIISPVKLCNAGVIDEAVATRLAAIDGHDTLDGDFLAQLSTVQLGVRQFRALMLQNPDHFYMAVEGLNDYGRSLAKAAFQTIADGSYYAEDVLDDDGFSDSPIKICSTITVKNGEIYVDFTGTDPQVQGNLNSPLSVAAAAVYYVFRCLLPEYTPACHGVFESIRLHAPKGCLLNAEAPAAVAAGNVETSTRVVDVILKALAPALPEHIPAASHGSMNNVAMGARGERNWDYYETIGGGMGAHPLGNGLSGVQTHMTNTLNTPVEVLESHYPLRINRYSYRKGSGGTGEHQGGDGIVREYQFLSDASLSLLTERRTQQPWGLNAQSAKAGSNRLNGEAISAKTQCAVKAGDVLTIETPGGGGWSKSTK